MPLRGTSTEGYTLIELLVVMVILALVAGIAMPAASSLVRAAKVRSDTSRLVTELRRMQDLAIQTQRTISITPAATKLETSTGQQIALSDSTTVEIAAPLIYYPDGTTAGGQITLLGGKLKTRIQVAWLTGAITAGGAP